MKFPDETTKPYEFIAWLRAHAYKLERRGRGSCRHVGMLTPTVATLRCNGCGARWTNE